MMVPGPQRCVLISDYLQWIERIFHQEIYIISSDGYSIILRRTRLFCIGKQVTDVLISGVSVALWIFFKIG